MSPGIQPRAAARGGALIRLRARASRGVEWDSKTSLLSWSGLKQGSNSGTRHDGSLLVPVVQLLLLLSAGDLVLLIRDAFPCRESRAQAKLCFERVAVFFLA